MLDGDNEIPLPPPSPKPIASSPDPFADEKIDWATVPYPPSDIEEAAGSSSDDESVRDGYSRQTNTLLGLLERAGKGEIAGRLGQEALLKAIGELSMAFKANRERIGHAEADQLYEDGFDALHRVARKHIENLPDVVIRNLNDLWKDSRDPPPPLGLFLRK